jgi:hypothetical protein
VAEMKHAHIWTPSPTTKQYVCACGAVRVAVLTTADFASIDRIDVWNRAMRNAKSRRKFIRTGEA